VFVKLGGGLRLVDSGLDLAVAAAVMSSYVGIPVRPYTAVFGEVR
jgi:predicted ATP-dependent serine protease